MGKFLGRFGRVINFDKRATGVSDRSARPLNLDQQVVDVEAIRIATNSKELIVCGLSQGAPLVVLYALAYPEPVKALILVEGVCCDANDPYASLSDSNTLFDWERSLADIDSDFAKWCRDFSKMMSPAPAAAIRLHRYLLWRLPGHATTTVRAKATGGSPTKGSY